MYLRLQLVAAMLATCMSPAFAASPKLIEPKLRLAHDPGAPMIAFTLDACSGKTDQRILDKIIELKIPVTVFVTGRWMKRNAQALAVMKTHADIFDLENHGSQHLMAVDRPYAMAKVKAAGSADAVINEAEQGAARVQLETGERPLWYRGAAAVYSPAMVVLLREKGFKIAGYSIAADGGATLSKAATLQRITHARSGDVLLAHINHPERPAGAGVAEGLAALKAKGYRFVRLANPMIATQSSP